MGSTRGARLVMNRRPNDTVGPSRRERGADRKRQSMIPRPLESLQELSSLLIVWQIRDARRAPESVTRVGMIGLLRATWHNVGEYDGIALFKASARSRL
jgi:hypothetical protein